MTSVLSDWAREFLREDHVAVISTLNKDGSPQVTTIWYLLQEDGTLIMSTPGRTHKVQNLRRDPRIAVCVGDERRSVSLYGTVTINSDQHALRRDLEQLTARYVKEEAARAPALSRFRPAAAALSLRLHDPAQYVAAGQSLAQGQNDAAARRGCRAATKRSGQLIPVHRRWVRGLFQKRGTNATRPVLRA